MRLKTMDGPLSLHNGNSDNLNSPKRINTVQNSNVSTTYNTTNYSTALAYNTTLSNNTINEAIKDLHIGDLNILNNVVEDKVQWCNPSHQEVQNQELTNNAINYRNNHLVNINNTLAATIGQRVRRHGTASSLCSPESSPDDSFLDFEEAQQSCSSVDTSPQDEDRAFDISDSESSEDGNLSNIVSLPQRRGIVNPNYPGFQHLAHTLVSDPDFTDDDLECDAFTAKLEAEANNNNNVEDTDYKIDSVNRLDSVENIQKVFYDKTVFNIEEDSEFNQNSESSSGNSNNSDEDTEVRVQLNIKIEERETPLENIVGDFSEEVHAELGKVTLEKENVLEDPYEPPKVEKAVVQELEEAVEKLQVIKDLKPSAIKYNIEPNVEQPFGKLSPTKQITLHQVLDDTAIVKNPEAMSVVQESLPLNVKLDDSMKMKIEDAFLSNATEDIKVSLAKDNIFVDSNLNLEGQMEVDVSFKKSELTRKDSNRELEDIECQIKKIKSDTQQTFNEVEKFCKEDLSKEYKEKDEDNTIPRKKEKMDTFVKKRRDYNQQFGSLITFPRREIGNRNRDPINRRSVPMAKEKKRNNGEASGGFDVYNIETAMPKIDLEAIECHLRAAREEERRRRTDREEIRRRLAMGSEDEFYSDRPGRKPSLQARLQSGMNLQICFMNESLSDTDSPSSDSECPMTNPKQLKTNVLPKTSTFYSSYQDKNILPTPSRPATLSIGQPLLQPVKEPLTEADFFTRQARLQTEARMALAQAKEMARMQMEIEKQRQKKSPITEMIRNSMEKVGIPFPEDKRRLSRQILTDMNVAQLQVIVNDLHTQIETLNESLVKFLMNRDDLHMEQDSMLVDIEDLTRYLGAKEQVIKGQNLVPTKNNNTPPSPAPSSPLSALNVSVRPHLHRIASLVKK
ncbi:schwannomin interacting protein 1 isoform X2 [Leptinotarsa decemlineata]